MSGGAYEYFYAKLEDFANSIPSESNPRRAAFKKLLLAAAQAAYAVEWEDSGDASEANAAIDRMFRELKVPAHDIYKIAAYDKVAELVAELGRAKSNTPLQK